MQAKVKKKVEAVELVKRRLWSHGYSVKRVDGTELGLVVEGKFRVAVRSKGERLTFPGPGIPFDVLAVVEFPTMGKPVVGYSVGLKKPWLSNPAEVFISSGKEHGKEKGKGKTRG